MNVKILVMVIVTFVFVACKNEYKVIPITSNNANPDASDVSSNHNENLINPVSNEFHTVVVNEVLPTSKYVYLNVNEGEEKYWIATSSMEVKVGGTYYYKGGLLKTNFESKE